MTQTAKVSALHHDSEIQVEGRVIRARLPAGWKLRNYVSNHHYVELEDPDGKIIKMPACALIKGVCAECSQSFYVESHLGDMTCPHCHGGVNWVWGHARLAFIAEQDAHFSTVPPPAANGHTED